MKKTKKLLGVCLSFLTLLSSISLVSCGETKHVHQYVETIIPSTCTTKGYTEHKCFCGDSYGDNEQELLTHDGRYKCTMCTMDFGDAFATMIKENGTNEQFIFEASNYGMIITTSNDYEILISLVSDVAGSSYTALLAYNAFDQKWSWVLEWGSKQAYGTFASLSSGSTSVPCSYSNFGTSVASLMKEIFSTMVYNANQKLKLYDARFTMENLGLKF